jgi:predicted ribosomally synthesized peptide with nif11-like leader
MSIHAFNDFRAKVAADRKLQDECRTAIAIGGAEIVKLGANHGFAFTAEEAQAAMDESELSDLELELVTGGCGGGATQHDKGD